MTKQSLGRAVGTGLFLVLLGLSPVSAASNDSGVQERVSAASGLTLTVQTAKALYEPTDGFEVRATLQNESANPITITLPTPCDTGLSAGLIDPAGEPHWLMPTQTGYCIQILASRTLAPGESVQATFSRPPSGATPPGLYTVRVATYAAYGSGPKVEADLRIRIGGFSDTTGHWADETVRKAAERGLALGYPDGTFRPDAPITRGEIIKLVSTVAGLRPMGDGGHWAAPWARAAALAGLGVDPLADLDVPASRAEIVRMLVLAGEIAVDDATQVPYPDVSADLLPFVSAAAANGLVNGYPDGTFGPTRTATRAEAMAMVLRLQDSGRGKISFHTERNVATRQDEKPATAGFLRWYDFCS